MRTLPALAMFACGCNVYTIGARELEIPLEEREFLRDFFLGALDADAVREYERGLVGPTGSNFCVGDDIFFLPSERYEANRAEKRNVLVHEATHAVQNQAHLRRLPDDNDEYNYRLLPERHLLTYGFEQQASIVQTYYQITDWVRADGYGPSDAGRCDDCAGLTRERMIEILTRRYAELSDF